MSRLDEIRVRLTASGELDSLESDNAFLLAEIERLNAALDAAAAFIDSHVADPDITEEMRRTYAAYQAAIAERKEQHE